MGTVFPILGNWYQAINGDLFKVVAVDESDLTVEIQYFDGALEEIELENWGEMQIREAVAPEDWSGSYDIEREDYGVDLEDNRIDDWNSPLDRLDMGDF